jgi:hypothetical protein
MPETLCTDWDSVRLRCRVVGSFLPGLVTVSVEPQEIPCDENLLHWDPVASVVFNTLLGHEINLRSTFVPRELSFPNTLFWLCVHSDRSWAIYAHLDSEVPLTRGSRAQAGM